MLGRHGLTFNLPHDALLAMERHPLHSVVQNESIVVPNMVDLLLNGPAKQNMKAAVSVLDGLHRVPLQWLAQNRGPSSTKIMASLLLMERAITPGNRCPLKIPKVTED